jgi:hypothetical protein
MPYREVTMIEVKEILRLWLDEVPKKRISRMLGVDRKTVLSAGAESVPAITPQSVPPR